MAIDLHSRGCPKQGATTLKPNTLVATVLLTAVACSGASAAGLDDLVGIELGGRPNFPVLPIATRYSGQETHVYVMDLQGAIDDAQPGDRIEVGPGTWPGGIVIDGINGLELTAPAGPTATVIDGGGLTRGVLVRNCVDMRIHGLGIINCVTPPTEEIGFIDGGGAGVLADFCPFFTITSCWFRGNTATLQGGGMGMVFTDNATVGQCVFQDNHATGIGIGGGLSIAYSTDGVIEDCWFTENTVNGGGGALQAGGTEGSRVTIRNCRFHRNEGHWAGAMHLQGVNDELGPGVVTMDNCHFIGNRATRVYRGSGAITIGGWMHVVATQSSFVHNRAHANGAIGVASSTLLMDECFMAGNRGSDGSDNIYATETATVRITRSHGDCHQPLAESIEGPWEDIAENGHLDHCGYTADLNWDGHVDIGDMLNLLAQWGNTPLQRADIARGDGETGSRVDGADLVRMLEAWGDLAPSLFD
jgi:hypothetical protein